MKLYLSGLQPDATESEIRELLASSLDIQHIEVCSEHTPMSPYALLTVADSYEHVWTIKNRFTGRYHRGTSLRMHIVTYQDQVHLVDSPSPVSPGF